MSLGWNNLPGPTRGSWKYKDWNWAEPYGVLLDTKAFPFVEFLIWRKKAFSFLDLPWVPKGIFKQLLTGEVEGRQEETMLQQGAWCWSLLGWCASSLCMSLSSSAGTRDPSTQTEEVTAGWAQTSGPKLIGKADDWDGWNTALLSHHQPVRGMFHTLQPLPLNFIYNSSSKAIREFGFFEH